MAETEQTSHSSLISKRGMEASARTATNARPLAHEIFTQVNNAKDKPKKIEVLLKHDSQALRQLLKAAFDPKIVFDIPVGTPPYIANDAPTGTDHTSLLDEARRLYIFINGASDIPKIKKETLFIQMLEALHKDDAEALITIKDKKLNLVYKGLTENVVREAFNWNEDFLRNN
jgi:hypothetical protein